MATPLLLHAITLPLGDDVFWESVNAEFTSSEWERRLKAGVVFIHIVYLNLGIFMFPTHYK